MTNQQTKRIKELTKELKRYEATQGRSLPKKWADEYKAELAKLRDIELVANMTEQDVIELIEWADQQIAAA